MRVLPPLPAARAKRGGALSCFYIFQTMQQGPVFQNYSSVPPALPPPAAGGGAGAGREWKEGLGSVAKATERHHKKNITLRKAKREHKLQERREISVIATTSDISIQDLIAHHYFPQKLLAYDMAQLNILSQILGRIEKDQFEKDILRIIDLKEGHVIRILVEALQRPPLVEHAADCIANMTAKMDNEAYLERMHNLLVQYNFLKVIYNVFLQANLPEKLRRTLWTIVANFGYCKKAQGAEIIYLSPLFTLIQEEIKQDSKEVAYPLVDIYKLLLLHADLPMDWLRVFYVELCKRARESVEEYFANHTEAGAYDNLEMCLSALTGIWLIFKNVDYENFIILLNSDVPTWLTMTTLNKYIFHPNADVSLQYRIMSVYNAMCALNDNVVARKIVQHDLMRVFVRAGQSNNPELRKEAYFCIGHFVSCGTKYTKIAMLPPYSIMDTLLPALRDGTYEIRKGAMYCCMSMFEVTHAERCENMAVVEECDALMRMLIVQHRLISIVLPFLRNPNATEPATLIDILNLIYAALVWNKTVVLQALEMSNGLEAFNQLANAVHLLKSQENTQVFDLAMKIDGIIEGKAAAAEMEVMELDIDKGLYQF